MTVNNIFQINTVLLKFLFIKESVPTKIWSSATDFSIDNNQKCFL